MQPFRSNLKTISIPSIFCFVFSSWLVTTCLSAPHLTLLKFSLYISVSKLYFRLWCSSWWHFCHQCNLSQLLHLDDLKSALKILLGEWSLMIVISWAFLKQQHEATLHHVHATNTQILMTHDLPSRTLKTTVCLVIYNLTYQHCGVIL